MPPSIRTRVAAALFSVLALQACADAPPTSVDGSPPRAARTLHANAEAESAVALVARGVAQALTRADFRQRVLEDLRDSPFPNHRVHLNSYLRGARGRPMAEAVAQGTGRSVAELHALLQTLPQLELTVPLERDRVRWTGSDDIVVVGTVMNRQQLQRNSSLAGYDTRSGASVTVPLGLVLPYPLLTVARAEIRYGADPESRRNSAPRHRRSTIGTPDTEFSLTTTGDGDQCDPTDPTLIVECPGTGGAEWSPGGVPIASGRTYQCFESLTPENDRDTDGIQDSCEAEVAGPFRPILQYQWLDTHRGREPYWAAKRGTRYNEIKVFYAFSYYADVGTNVYFNNVGPHYGDAEFVVFTFDYWGGNWRFKEAFLSAHYGKYGWNSSSTRSSEVFSYPDNGFRPKIWIAKDKHANYHSQGKCDEGANYFDTCDDPAEWLEDFEFAPEFNLGNNESGTRLLDRVATRKGYSAREERFWTDSEFRGWQAASGPGSTGYMQWLNDFDF